MKLNFEKSQIKFRFQDASRNLSSFSTYLVSQQQSVHVLQELHFPVHVVASLAWQNDSFSIVEGARLKCLLLKSKMGLNSVDFLGKMMGTSSNKPIFEFEFRITYEK